MLRSRMTLMLLVFISLMTREALSMAQDCMDIPTETHWTPDQMEGTWYPMEIVLHRNDSKIYGVPVDSECPVVTFTRGKPKQLYMVWNTTNGDVKFTFQQKSTRANSQWQSVQEQSGSLVNEQYRPYAGVFRLLKLEGDYMFLSFCSSKYRLLSTVAFSKSEEMPEEVRENALAKLDAKNYKRAREIHTRPCLDKDSAPISLSVSSGLLVTVTLLSVLHH